MIVFEGWSATIVVFILITTVWAQEAPKTDAPPDVGAPGPAPAPAPAQSGDSDNGFIVPERMHGDIDSFTYESTEYIAVSRKRRFKTAALICKIEFNGKLALIDDNKKAVFMAEALSETNLVMDALWIAGKRDRVGDNLTDWNWIDGREKTKIDDALVKTFSKVPGVESNRECLAFARLDHDKPDYRELSCNAQRAVLCERAKGGGEGNSSHPGWIKLGKRQYKIFTEQVTYEIAKKKCFQVDHDAQLAVLINYNYTQRLGRYLLIGRPSLENAWIGARWANSSYAFEPEPIELANITTDKWPPWRNNGIQKTGGCILLDRHLANTTLFVEARCERERGYICYKMTFNISNDEITSDVIINNNGYRIHYKQRTWQGAFDFCKENYARYGAGLAEIRDKTVVPELIYVMGENRTAIQHIWLAGTYSTEKNWTWVNGDAVDHSVLNLVYNNTYNDEVEDTNTCLNMDRENHLTALHYGAQCEALQTFVCTFTKEKLEELIKAEQVQATDRAEKDV